MKKYISMIILCVVSLSLYTESKIASINSKKELDELIAISFQPIAVQFHSGCAICNVTRRHLQEMVSQYPNMKFVEVDIEKVPNLAERYGIAALPTVLIFEPRNENPVYTITGPNREILEEKINNVLAKKR